MDLRRLRTGEWLLAGTAILALVSLFLPWYGGDAGTATGWEGLRTVDILLAAAAALALAVVVITAQQSTAAAGIASQSLFLFLAVLVAAAVVIRTISLPGNFETREVGVFLGLCGALGMVVSDLLAMRDERLSAPGRLTDSTGVPVDSQPEVETLPAPPREAGA